MKYVLTVFLTALVVGVAAISYFKDWLPSLTFNKPRAVSVQNTEVSTTTAESTSIPSPSPSPVVVIDNNQKIITSVKADLISKHGSDFSNLDYSINKVEGDYASGTVNGTGGGGMWFAAKVNSAWVIVSDGNGVTLCSDLTAYPSFPKDMVPECWDSLTNKLVTR